MAARDRDRFGGWAEPATTPLQRYIQNACDPQNFEPNLALDLEISDLINAKKGTAPREAAIAIVNHINNRNPNVSLLALTLLDICVKNCGYPFHLQISTKEFLNELVRRFPERPPIRYSRVQAKILELIEEWRQTICQTSKYKEDLGFIRDMHRLLSYKGYVFPEVKREDAAVLNPSDSLRSAEEMEAEERAAQSAKLQELIRRGTPHDLQEANKLMKVMAGYDNRHKTDYRAKAAEEVGKVQQKAKILEDMLQEYRPGDDSINSETWEELGNALASAHPKIQKMCEEESDDTEAVAKLFEINDSIHRTLERYRLTKRGDLQGAARIPKGTLGTSGAGVRQGANNELSLIDFGFEEENSLQNLSDPVATTVVTKDSRVEDDLLGLSLQEASPAVNIPSVQLTANPSTSSTNPIQYNRSVIPPLPMSTGSKLPETIKPNYDLNNSLKPIQQSTQSRTSPAIASDPFASLSTPASRTSSPFQFQQSIRPPPSAAAMLLNLDTPSQQSHSAVKPQQSISKQHGASLDDEWTFSSSLPDNAQEIDIANTSVHITFLVSRPAQLTNAVLIKSSISNNTAKQITDLTFQLAVTKGYSLKLEPQSGRNLSPLQRGGITQTIQLHGVEPGKATSVRIRWKTSYWLGGERREEQGEISSLGIA